MNTTFPSRITMLIGNHHFQHVKHLLRLRLVGLVGAGVTAGGSSVTGVGGGVLGRDSTDCMEAVDTCRERAVLSLFKV